MSDVKHVYKAISKVTEIMSREGLSKSRSNQQQGYKFRGIDDVYNALSGHLAEVGLCILPRIVERTAIERATKSGGVSTYTILLVDFDLVSSVDGSSHTIRTVGEAMDTADKSSNKAMSAAMKYACLMAFQIPTEGDNDADAHTHETSFVGALAGSVAEGWDKFEGRHIAAMQAAKTMGELSEAWTEAYDAARKVEAPSSVVKKLSLVKDDRKQALGSNGNGARA